MDGIRSAQRLQGSRRRQFVHAEVVERDTKVCNRFQWNALQTRKPHRIFHPGLQLPATFLGPFLASLPIDPSAPCLMIRYASTRFLVIHNWTIIGLAPILAFKVLVAHVHYDEVNAHHRRCEVRYNRTPVFRQFLSWRQVARICARSQVVHLSVCWRPGFFLTETWATHVLYDVSDSLFFQVLLNLL